MILNERKLNEEDLLQRNRKIQALLKNKQSLVKRYGPDAEKVMYGIATKQIQEKYSKMEPKNKDLIYQKIKEVLSRDIKEQKNVVSEIFGMNSKKLADKVTDILDRIENHPEVVLSMQDGDKPYKTQKIIRSLLSPEERELFTNIINKGDLGYYSHYDSRNTPEYRVYHSNIGKRMKDMGIKIQSFTDRYKGNYPGNMYKFKGSNDINESNDQETGLMVIGRTQVDNNEIGDVLDELGLYGEWDSKEGYWFIPEEEDLYDSLEVILDKEFGVRGINARFEGIF